MMGFGKITTKKKPYFVTTFWRQKGRQKVAKISSFFLKSGTSRIFEK